MRKTLYARFNHSPVYLDEHNHVYVHKTTGTLYSSVTSALNLIKEEFNKESVIEGLLNQYQNVQKWYQKNLGNASQFPDFLRDYVRFNKKRPFSWKTYNGKQNKVYKRLNEYNSIHELHSELLKIKKVHEFDVPPKAIYLNSDGSIMNRSQILHMWDVTNLLSRHYGHMIHESLETHILESQGFHVDRFEKLSRIQSKYVELKNLLESIDKTFNEEFFAPYIVDLPPFQLMEWIIMEFKKLNANLGYVAIPEKINFSETYQICGTTDIEIVLDEDRFMIGDHKTNKKYSFESEYGKHLLPPFDDMEDCEHSSHILQLNTYGLIQEMDFGRRFEGSWISYFNRDFKKFELIHVPTDLHKAKKLMEFFKTFQDETKEKFLMSGIFDNIDSKYYNVLTKLLYENINKRRKQGLDGEDKTQNKKHYTQYVQDIVLKLSTI